MPGVTASVTLRAGWRTVVQQPERILVATIAVTVPAIALHVVAQYLIGVIVAGDSDCTRQFLGTTLVAHCGPTEARGGLALLTGLFAFYLIGHLVVAALYRSFLDVVDDQPAQGPLRGVLRALPVALILGTVLAIGTVFLLLPAVVLGFFSRYAVLFVVDRGLGPFAAIGASFGFCGRRLGAELGFALRAAGVLLLGLLVLGAGLFVAIPVVLLAQTRRYREENPATAARAY
jgi:uncharacterized membrane protein